MGIPSPAGYYDRFDPNGASGGWKRVLCRPDMPFQSAEANEIQSMIQAQIEQIADEILSDGTYVSGGKVSINRSGNDLVVSITPGRMYALGFVHPVPAGEVVVTGSGREVVSLLINSVVVTEEDDPSLLDPATGTENEGDPGAHRLTVSYQFVLDNPNAIPVAVLQDGQLVEVSRNNALLDLILKIMAQRTAEKDGSFVAQRAEISLLDPPDTSTNSIQLDIAHGVGYINGVRRENGVTYLTILRPLESAPITGEAHTFLTGTDVYALSSLPVAKVTSILATLQSPSFQLTRGAQVNGQDGILGQYLPVASIVSVSQGVTTYVQGVDYILSGNSISWVNGGNAPLGGTSYNVTVQYTKTLTKAVRTQTLVTEAAHTVALGAVTLAHQDLHSVTLVKKADNSVTYVEGVDYTVNKRTGVITCTTPADGTALKVSYLHWAHTVEGDYVSRDSFVSAQGNVLSDATPTKTPNDTTVDYKKHVSFDTTSLFHPVNNSSFYTTYEVSLPRTDVLIWHENGIFEVVKGIPSISPETPKTPPTALQIVKFKMPAEAKAADVVREYYNNETLKVTDLRDMLHTINDIQFNLAQFEMEQQLTNRATPTNKIGIFADALDTPLRQDRDNVDFAGTLDVLGRAFMLPRTHHAVTPTLSSANATVFDGAWIPTFTEEAVVTQAFASEPRVINKYGSINNLARITLSNPFNNQALPSAFKYTTVYEPGTARNMYISDMSNCRFLANLSPKTALAARLGLPDVGPGDPWFVSKVQTASGWSDVIKDTLGANPLANAVVVSETSSVQSNQWAQIIRNTQVLIAGTTPAAGTLTVSGTNFLPNDQAITCVFNGKPVTLTGINGTVNETDPDFPGGVRASATGTFQANLTIPSNVKVGVNKIEVVAHDLTDNRMTSYATTNYIASPNLEYVDLTVKVAKDGNGWTYSWIAPSMAFADSLGLPQVVNDAGYQYSSWWAVCRYSWQSIGLMLAQGIALCVENGITLTQEQFENALGVFFAYSSLGTILTGDMLQNIAEAVNLSSTDINANSRAMITASPYLGNMLYVYMQGYIVDPLAQTFTVPEDRMISSVGLYFYAAPTTESVGVAISEVENGVPTGPYLVAKYLQPNQITASNNASVVTNFVFDKKVYLDANKDYAFVILTNDPVASVWTAVLGQKDIQGNLITKNPAAGVALESADAKSWQPLSATDVKFEINACTFTNQTSTITTGKQTFAGDVCRVSFDVPFKEMGQGATVQFQYSLDNTTWVDMYPQLEADLKGAYDEIYFRVLMHNNRKICPVLLNSPSIDGFIFLPSGNYVHRQVVLPSASARYFDCYIETDIPGSTSINVYTKLDNDAYVQLTEVGADAVAIDDVFTRRHYTYDAGVGNLKAAFRTKIALASSLNYVTPRIRRVEALAR